MSKKLKPLIFGISGTKLTECEKELFQKNWVYGFIIFKRNIESPQQLTKLIEDLRGLYQYKVYIFVDQEGGRVARLKPPMVDEEYAPASFFGDIYRKEGKEKAGVAVFGNYSKLMQGLHKYDIDSPLAPVADISYIETHSVIGDRSFGNSIAQVVDLCVSAIEAIENNGGIAVIKHIPGHGRACLDSHLALPTVKTSLEELNKSDFEIFRQLSKLDNVWAMTAHIIFTAIDADLPVTLSKKAIAFIRQDIGFKNILVSDDICMLALHGEIGAKYLKHKADIEKFPELKNQFIGSIARVAYDILQAGCDLVLHCSGNIAEMTAICQVVDVHLEESSGDASS